MTKQPEKFPVPNLLRKYPQNRKQTKKPHQTWLGFTQTVEQQRGKATTPYTTQLPSSAWQESHTKKIYAQWLTLKYMHSAYPNNCQGPNTNQ